MRTAEYLLLLVFLSLTTIVSADSTDVSPPDPSRLSADWWSYVEPKEKLSDKEANRRIEALDSMLETIARSSDSLRRDDYRRLTTRIRTELQRFAAVRNGPPVVETTARATKQRYSLTEALTLHSEWRSVQLKAEAEQEETAWLSTAIEEQRRRQSRQRTRYLDLKKTDPDRLLRGLELMSARIMLETRRLGLEQRRSALSAVQELENRLGDEIEALPARLYITPDEISEWENRGQEANSAVSRLNNQPDAGAFDGSAGEHPGTPLLGTRYDALVGMNRELEIGLQETIAMQAKLISTLPALLDNTANVDSDSIRDILAGSSKLNVRLSEQTPRWRRVLERVRASGEPSERRQQTDKLLADTEASLYALVRTMESSRFVSGIVKDRLQKHEGWLYRYLQNARTTLTTSWSATFDTLGATLFEINETPVTALGIFRIIIIITLTLWLSKAARRAIQRVGVKRGTISESSLYTVGRLIHYFLLTIGIIIGLSSIGIDFTKFALFASALGVGIGFGLQTLIGNFVAGLIILFEKSLKVSDFVELESGVTGEVKEINMRSTLITTNDNIDILVPNSEFVGGRVINWTLREVYRRTHIPFGVAYGTDKEVVRKAVLEAADLVPWTLKNKKGRHPQVWFVEFGDSSLNFELIVWLTPEAVKRPGAVTAAYLWEIETKLKEYSIEIPFPQRDLHVRSLFGVKDQAAHDLIPGINQKPDDNAS